MIDVKFCSRKTGIARREKGGMTTRLTLISHAPTQAQRRAAFPADESLEEQEFAKVAALGWKAPRVQRIWSAPERQTQQTAQALGLSAAIALELHDCDYGAWQGREFDELQSAEPEGVMAWLTDAVASPHGGESIIDLINRVGRWLDEQRDAGHTLAVTHPAVIRGAIVHALQAPAQSFWRIDIAPLSLTDLRFNGRVWTVRSTACPLQRTD
jgi:broad specificity phosphatase PhoE